MRKVLTTEEKLERKTKRHEENKRRKAELPWGWLESSHRHVELRLDEGETDLQVLFIQKEGPPDRRVIYLEENLQGLAEFLQLLVMRYNYLVRLANETVDNIPPLAQLKKAKP